MTTKWYPCDIKFYSKIASGSTTEKVKIISGGLPTTDIMVSRVDFHNFDEMHDIHVLSKRH